MYRDDWYEVAQLDAGTWVLSEPHHPERTHFYLLSSSTPAGRPENLLIDTGMGFLPIRPLIESLCAGPVQVALTHAHWDHIGALAEYPRFMVHGAEADFSHPSLPLDDASIRANACEEEAKLPDGFDLSAYHAYRGAPARVLSDGDVVHVGTRVLEVLHTPGHSPGSVCYLERERGCLFSGDLVYGACLYLQFSSCDPRAYRDSLQRVDGLSCVERILPGHDGLDISPNLPKRILAAIEELDQQGLYRKGCGRHDFEGFSIAL